MKQPFTSLTFQDVEELRNKPLGVPSTGKSFNYSFSNANICAAQQHLSTLYKGKVQFSFAERILIRNEIY